MSDVVDAAVADAGTLAASGFPALMVENFGDVPFYSDSVPPETVAAMTVAIGAVMGHVGLPIGVNVLRNDALSAVAIAAGVGADFIRVNVLTGTMFTDQGPIVGKAHEVHRAIKSLGHPMEVWADVMVKHATPPHGLDLAQATLDTVERGLADAVIVSGPGTGTEPDIVEAKTVRANLPDGIRLVVGSGACVENLGELINVADSVIVGSSLKADSHPGNPIDRHMAAQFADAAREGGLI